VSPFTKLISFLTCTTQNHPKTHHTAHQAEHPTVTAELQTHSTAKVHHPSSTNSTLLKVNTSNTPLKAKATLPKDKATHLRANKATRNSNPTARLQSPLDLQRQWEHLLPCHRAGSNNGTKAASAGTTSSKPRAAHNGIPPHTSRQALTHLHRPERRTRLPADTTSAPCLVIPKDTRATTTHPQAPRQTRKRRRRIRADTRLPCLLLRESAVWPLVLGLDMN
jgi:hypothetical protein